MGMPSRAARLATAGSSRLPRMTTKLAPRGHAIRGCPAGLTHFADEPVGVRVMDDSDDGIVRGHDHHTGCEVAAFHLTHDDAGDARRMTVVGFEMQQQTELAVGVLCGEYGLFERGNVKGFAVLAHRHALQFACAHRCDGHVPAVRGEPSGALVMEDDGCAVRVETNVDLGVVGAARAGVHDGVERVLGRGIVASMGDGERTDRPRVTPCVAATWSRHGRTDDNQRE